MYRSDMNGYLRVLPPENPSEVKVTETRDRLFAYGPIASSSTSLTSMLADSSITESHGTELDIPAQGVIDEIINIMIAADRSEIQSHSAEVDLPPQDVIDEITRIIVAAYREETRDRSIVESVEESITTKAASFHPQSFEKPPLTKTDRRVPDLTEIMKIYHAVNNKLPLPPLPHAKSAFERILLRIDMKRF